MVEKRRDNIVEKESDSSKAETRTEELYRHRIDRPSQGHVVSNEHVSSKGTCKKSKKKGIELTQCSGKIDAGKALHIFTV